MTEVSTKFKKENIKQMLAWALAIVMCFSLVKISTSAVEGSTLKGAGYTEYCCTTGNGTTRANANQKLNHHYTNAPTFTWAEDGKSCSARFECAFGDGWVAVDCNVTGKVVQNATCSTWGTTEYTATVTMENKTYTSTKKVADIAPAHAYETTITKATPTKDGKEVTACIYCKQQSSSTPILKPSKTTISTTSYTYDGKAKKPAVTVKDSKENTIAASNYDVTYSNNKTVGTAKVVITFKGDKYEGKVTKTFKILPKKTSISAAKSTKANTATITWKKQTKQVSGYQVRYAKNSKMTKSSVVTVKGATKKNTTIKKLTAGKTYYVQVRTYKVVDGKKVYSGWSTAKKVTIK